MTSIRECVCEHEFQDARYGHQKRVHNRTEGNTNPKWTCTVCGRKESAAELKAKP
jgi:hypothetical protein